MEKLSKSLKVFSELRQKIRRTNVESFLIPLENFLPCERLFKFCGLPLFGRIEIGRARKFVWGSVGVLMSFAIWSLVSLGVYWGDPERFQEIIENLGAIAASILMSLKTFWCLFYNRKRTKEVILMLDVNYPRFSFQQHNHNVRKYLKDLKVIMWIAGILYFGFVTQFVAFPFERQIHCWMTSQTCKMATVVKNWFPFDASQPIPNFITWVWYVSTGLTSGVVILALDMFYAGLMTILSMEFDILAADMEEAQDEADLRKLINVHQQLIEIAGKLEEIFSPILLCQVFLATSAICFAAFLTFMDLSPMIIIQYSGFLFCCVINCFVVCHYAQKLTDSSSSIAFAAFSTPWYERGLLFQKLVLIVMMMAREGKKLTAWRFFDVSMETFYWMLDTAYSYYSVLMGLYDGK